MMDFRALGVESSGLEPSVVSDPGDGLNRASPVDAKPPTAGGFAHIDANGTAHAYPAATCELIGESTSNPQHSLACGSC